MTAERAALNILQKVTMEGAYANLALKEELPKASKEDSARISALVYSALENIGYCDHLIEHYAKGRVHSIIRNLLRLSLTEIFFMDTPDYAACSKALKLTEDIGKAKLKGFVNGVLRSIIRDRDKGVLPPLPQDPVKKLSVLSGWPDFMIEEYVGLYGEGFAEELVKKRITGTSFRPVYPHTLDELEEHFNSLGVECKKSSLVPDSLIAEGFNRNIAEDEFFTEGSMTVQSEGAMLACRALSVRPGMKVLDACAAPGGKTAYLSDLMRREGKIVSWDVHPHRVELIKNTLTRLRISNVSCDTVDASVYDPDNECAFDAVLLDVPCSGLGGGSKPDAKMRRTDDNIEELAKLQLSILRSCSRYLKTGGFLVYSTCTISRLENEEVIERFLADEPGFIPAELESILPAQLKGRSKKGMLQLFPNIDETEGFFIAKLQRTV